MRKAKHQRASLRVEPQWTVRCVCGWVMLGESAAECETAHEAHEDGHRRPRPTTNTPTT